MQTRSKFFSSLIAPFVLMQTVYAQKQMKLNGIKTTIIEGVFAINNEQYENVKSHAFNCPWPCGGGSQITSNVQDSDCPWPRGGKSEQVESVKQDCPWPCDGVKNLQPVFVQSDVSLFLEPK